ncbi:undecaprenyl-diphosphate phosphatase BcrC [Bacillus sp. T17B1]|uniref:undecaprenyl-diphosphate phosphatase BcrC n=1 Tax=Bacillus sp. T17B1 TaxID=2918911 RepID=UPI00227EE12F|nr:undecaprenyl-diphosphate phosphatase BcrC [Bacillus sp. T17B1]
MNYEIFKAIHGLSHHNSVLDSIMVFITEYAIVAYALILLAIWLFGNTQSRKNVLYAGLTGIAGLVINFLITQVYFEPRPFVAHTVHTLIPHDADASFPSDHTTGALAISIAMLFRNRKIGWPLVIFGLLTGFSRIWVGHHYPVDVLGSLVVSIIIGFLFFRFSDLLRPFVDLIVRIYETIINKLTKKQTDQNF